LALKVLEEVNFDRNAYQLKEREEYPIAEKRKEREEGEF